MNIESQHIADYNQSLGTDHNEQFNYIASRLEKKGINSDSIINKLSALKVAIPSWALGAGGTRFGRFSIGGEPRSLEEKLADIGIIKQLTQVTDAVSLHIPWDIPNDYDAIKQLANELKIEFAAVNSNTFQDQNNQGGSYKFGSLQHVNKDIRDIAVQHNKEVIDIGNKLGSKSLTVWLADGSCFPGQLDMRNALDNTLKSLQDIYMHLPSDWRMLIEYKPYEPNFYSTTIPDWGTSHLLAQYCGEQAYTLVDLGHHLPNTNIEQIVSTLQWLKKLGGFHFNDSKYGDDDVTTGSLKPYQLFLIFNELVQGMEHEGSLTPEWMIDASHNVKDPLEDLIQSLEAIQIAYAQALLVDRDALKEARGNSDVTQCQDILQEAFRTDVRPIVAEARKRQNGAIDPIAMYRNQEIRKQLIGERGEKTVATGL